MTSLFIQSLQLEISPQLVFLPLIMPQRKLPCIFRTLSHVQVWWYLFLSVSLLQYISITYEIQLKLSDTRTMSSIVWPLHIPPQPLFFSLILKDQLLFSYVRQRDALQEPISHAWLTVFPFGMSFSQASTESLNFVYIIVIFNKVYEYVTIIL